MRLPRLLYFGGRERRREGLTMGILYTRNPFASPALVNRSPTISRLVDHSRRGAAARRACPLQGWWFVRRERRRGGVPVVGRSSGPSGQRRGGLVPCRGGGSFAGNDEAGGGACRRTVLRAVPADSQIPDGAGAPSYSGSPGATAGANNGVRQLFLCPCPRVP
jgi:hypothetical protein